VSGLGIRSVTLVGALSLALGVFAPAANAGVRDDSGPSISLHPTSGPAGASIMITGTGWFGTSWTHQPCGVALFFVDADGVQTHLGSAHWGRFKVHRTIPAGAAEGAGTVRASQGFSRGCELHFHREATFTVVTPFTQPNGRATREEHAAAPRSPMAEAPIVSDPECTTPQSHARNVILNCPEEDSFATHEPTIAVDPSNPSHMVVQSNDFASKGPTPTQEFYTTFDGGRTWTDGDLPLGGEGRFAFDPAVTIDPRHGTVIAAMQPGRPKGKTQCDNDEATSVSTDGGLHWLAPVDVGSGTGCYGDQLWVGFDSDSIVTDDNPASPYFGRTYLTAGRVVCHRKRCLVETIVESHSDDGGFSWSPLQTISGSNPEYCTAPPKAPACDNSARSSITVSPDGSVHAAIWNAQNRASWEPGECCELQILAVGSEDGGATWSEPVHVVDMEDGSRDYPGCEVDGGLAFCLTTGTQLYATPAFGFGNIVASPIDGTLYIAFSDNRNGRHDVDHPVSSEDVFLMTSYDGGGTWAGPDLVSGSPGDEWFAQAAVNPLTGELAVAFNDRASTYAQTFDVTLAIGLPGSFSSVRITTKSSHLRDNLWFPAGVQGCEKCVYWTGDYIGLAFDTEGTAHAVWTDLRRRVTVPDVGTGYTENIFYAAGTSG
jgi:hypothetical protein